MQEGMIAGIGYIDWIAIILYLVVTIGAGLYTASKIKDTTDFFMGGHSFGKIFMIFFSFGAGTSGNDAVGVSSKTATNGLSGIWYQWLWLFCTPFYWLIAPVMRRMRSLTTGDYFEARYNGSVSGLYTLVGVTQLTVGIGMIQLGAGKMIAGLTGDAISANAAIIAMTVLFVSYGVAGGLAAAIITDLIQGILTVILSFILIFPALNAVGGFAGIHAGIDNPDMFKLSAPGEINGFFIAMMCTVALIGIVTQPHIMGVCAAGRTEMDGRVGFATGNLLKRFCTIAWMVVGLCGVVMYMGQDVDPDKIYGMVASDLLPDIMPGLIGLFIAALIASVMSSCDAFMVSSSGLFTQNFYRRWFAKDKEEIHYVWVARGASLVIVFIALTFAFNVSTVPEALKIFFKIQGAMGAAFWLGLFWRRMTVAGAWASTLAGLAVLILNSAWLFPGIQVWMLDTLPESMIWNDKLRVSWEIFFMLTAGFGMGILVSLFTKRVDEAKLNKVYECLRTPVTEDEPHTAEPFHIPEGIEIPEARKLINHPDLEIPMPTAVGIGGFLFFWAWVAGLIGFVFWMATWGAPVA